ncbi:hypothetical protein PCASD_21666 [Puccinia coronata f. sp. avenae]|uniref:Integrase catalytic domain-containing protein n=1 Tax=Puccinia coronata f. sp. avenae TaxID=200324 RepID=A0A2N5SAP5_9BASI|nr:hypothetical protein PCASD_21666 [Puccinia coronata f. sp. avenae]
MHRQPFSGHFPSATKPLEIIHMDLCGPMTPASRGGNLYFLKIIDGYSKYRFIYPLRLKSDTFRAFSNFLSKAEKASGHQLISVVSDNGGEFVNKHFQSLFSSRGIQHITSAPYTPQQNPIAERGNRTTIVKTRAMLATAGMPLFWWGEAITTAVYLENRSPDSSINFKSPYELWKGSPPDLTHLVPFGCRALWVPSTRKIKEAVTPCPQTPEGPSSPLQPESEKSPSVPSITPIPENSVAPDHPAPSGRGFTYVPHFDKAPLDINSNIDASNIIEGPRRRQALVIHRHQANLIVGEPTSLKDPRTFGDVLGRLDEAHWLMAVEVELNNIRRHEVWVVAPLTPGAKLLDTTWVFKRKFDANGELLKYKARLCVRGFGQVEGIDYDATFAPTGRLTTLRLILGLAALHNYDIQQMDVKCAFLNGIPDEDLFIKVPNGVGVELPAGHGLKLLKSLYGLKQSPRCWYRSLKKFFLSINFLPAEMDPCLFIHQDPTRSRFEMDDLGNCQWVLGMRVTRDRTNCTLTLSQDRHCREILDEYGMLDCQSITSPLPTNATTCPIDPAPISKGFNYRRGVGLLNYLVQCTRPDLAFTCSYLSQFLNKPSKTHQNHFLHFLRYLQHTKNFGITLGAVSTSPSTLVAYSDASYATSTEAYSFAGSAILHNGLIGWRQDIVWTQQLLDSLRPYIDLPPTSVTLHCDNQGALALLKDTLYQHRTRHINVRYHWLRHHIELSETFYLAYVPTDRNVADFLTKPLTPIKNRQALDHICLKACDFKT